MSDTRLIAQSEAEAYNKSLPRFPKIAKSEKAEPTREVRKGRTADPDDPMYSRQPIVSGIEQAGLSPSVIRTPPLHRQRETTGVDEFLVLRKRPVQQHQRGSKGIELRDENSDG